MWIMKVRFYQPWHVVHVQWNLGTVYRIPNVTLAWMSNEERHIIEMAPI
jgi:hypothetical protein